MPSWPSGKNWWPICRRSTQNALKTEQLVAERIKEGVDSPQMQNKAHLSTRAPALATCRSPGRHRRDSQSAFAFDRAGRRPPLRPNPNPCPLCRKSEQEDDLAGQAVRSSPAVQAAESRAIAEGLRATGRTSRHVAFGGFRGAVRSARRATTITRILQRRSSATTQPSGLCCDFPFFSPTQHARAEAADATALKAKKDAETARNQVSEETLRLQRSVEQMAAAQEVADLEYRVAQSDLESMQVRLDAGTAGWHDVQDAREQTSERYNSLQDANFQLERARDDTVAGHRRAGKLDWSGQIALLSGWRQGPDFPLRSLFRPFGPKSLSPRQVRVL